MKRVFIAMLGTLASLTTVAGIAGATERGQASVRTWHTEKTVGIDNTNPGITHSAGTEFASVRPRTSRGDRQMGDDSVRG